MQRCLGAALLCLTAALSGCVVSSFHCTQSSQCGAGGACEATDFCSASDPACASGRRYVEGSGALSGVCVPQSDLGASACTNTQSDPQNCGSCGHACATGEYCQAGACTSICGLTACGSSCVDTRYDTVNCGSCGHACATGDYCQASTCTPTCTLTVCGSACIDTQTDTQHCGDCATTCPTGQTCTAGACACPAATPNACSANSIARFNALYGITTDLSGNIFVVDAGNHNIRRFVPATGAVTTIAGSAGNAGSTDGTGTNALFYYPTGLSADTQGNLFVADQNNHVIRKIVIASGVVSTLAGAAQQSGSTDGTGTNARFFYPWSVGADASGNVFVADTSNETIRKIVVATGAVSTLAGAVGQTGGTDGTGTSALFLDPFGVSADNAGNIFVAEWNGETVRKIVVATAEVTTLAGLSGHAGSADGVGTSARFYELTGVTADNSGNVFVAEMGHNNIRKIAVATRVVTTLAGDPGARGGSADGTGTSALFNDPYAVSADASGNVFVADTGNETIRKIVVATGVVTKASGVTGRGGATDSGPSDFCVDLISDANNCGACNFNCNAGDSCATGVCVAGCNGSLCVADDACYSDGQGTAACLPIRQSCYGGIWCCASGNLCDALAASGDQVDYCDDANNGCASYVSGDGVPSCADSDVHNCGACGLDCTTVGSMNSVCVAGKCIDLAADANNCGGVGNVCTSGCCNDGVCATDLNTDLHNCGACGLACDTSTQSCVAGVCTCSGASAVDACATGAQFRSPYGVAADGAGNVFVADTDNDAIRKIVVATGTVTTLAGALHLAGSADGTGTNARFSGPNELVADGDGNLFVADTNNTTIRKIVVATRTVTTIAGAAGQPGTSDGTGASARFSSPQAVAVDNAGDLFIVDNQTVRKLVLDSSIVTTLAGVAGQTGSADGTGTSARFYNTAGVTADHSGNLYVADATSRTIRQIAVANGAVTTIAGVAGQFSVVEGTGTAARFSYPWGVSVDNTGNLFISDQGGDIIRKMVLSTGVVSFLAGGGVGNVDGSGTQAKFSVPVGVSVDNMGNLFVADQSAFTVRKVVTTTAAVTTLAGTPSHRGASDSTSSACFDLQSDANHCGTCDVVCSTSCVAGVCQ